MLDVEKATTRIKIPIKFWLLRLLNRVKVGRQNDNEPPQEEERSAVFEERFEVGLIRGGFHSRPRDIGQIIRIRANASGPGTGVGHITLLS
jgi:hypothetical protein